MFVSVVRARRAFVEYDQKFSLGFLFDEKKLNTALTRATSLLVLVADPYIVHEETHWRRLLQECKQLGCYQGIDFTDDEYQQSRAREEDQVNEDEYLAQQEQLRDLAEHEAQEQSNAEAARQEEEEKMLQRSAAALKQFVPTHVRIRTAAVESGSTIKAVAHAPEPRESSSVHSAPNGASSSHAHHVHQLTPSQPNAPHGNSSPSAHQAPQESVYACYQAQPSTPPGHRALQHTSIRPNMPPPTPSGYLTLPQPYHIPPAKPASYPWAVQVPVQVPVQVQAYRQLVVFGARGGVYYHANGGKPYITADNMMKAVLISICTFGMRAVWTRQEDRVEIQLSSAGNSSFPPAIDTSQCAQLDPARFAMLSVVAPDKVPGTALKVVVEEHAVKVEVPLQP